MFNRRTTKNGKIYFSKNKYVTSMQDAIEKRWWTYDLIQNGNILIKKIETNHNDILIIQCQIYVLEIRPILIYMSVTNYDSNNQLMKYIQDHIDFFDFFFNFNGHIGF